MKKKGGSGHMSEREKERGEEGGVEGGVALGSFITTAGMRQPVKTLTIKTMLLLIALCRLLCPPVIFIGRHSSPVVLCSFVSTVIP